MGQQDLDRAVERIISLAMNAHNDHTKRQTSDKQTSETQTSDTLVGNKHHQMMADSWASEARKV